jgi:integrase
MGRGRPGTGVEPLKSCIRIGFPYQGKRARETLDLKPTPANIRAAERLVEEIKRKISVGAFEYAEYFPNSPRAGLKQSQTFEEYAKKWLSTLTVQRSTLKGYKLAIEGFWVPAFKGKLLQDIRYTDVAKAVKDKADEVGPKTVNNVLIPLRRVFRAAIADKLLKDNPALEVKNLTVQKPDPDPFDRTEMERIIAYMREKYPPQIGNYFEFAFMTGLRTSELIALRWGDVDWNRSTVTVRRARVRFREKTTKTAKPRDVDLNGRALDALRRQKAITFMIEGDPIIFNNPNNGRPWSSDRWQRVNFFYPALKALKIRKRNAYQTRHTFATTALMGGINPAYIAKQLGHANTAMLFKHYSKWIDGADKGAESRKLDALFAHELPTGVVKPAEIR